MQNAFSGGKVTLHAIPTNKGGGGSTMLWGSAFLQQGQRNCSGLIGRLMDWATLGENVFPYAFSPRAQQCVPSHRERLRHSFFFLRMHST